MNNEASHIIDEIFGVIAQPFVLPESIPAEVTMHGVVYVGRLYPQGEKMVMLRQEDYDVLSRGVKQDVEEVQ